MSGSRSIPKPAQVRLQKEYLAIKKSPIENVDVKPDDNNLLVWYFVISGPADTPYYGGEYFGVILFERNYPFSPPHFKVFTPSGRFIPGDKICMSMTGFHKESWNPLWSVQSMLVGLISYMCSDELGTGTVSTTAAQKRTRAKQSWAWNRQSDLFQKHFPDKLDMPIDQSESLLPTQIEQPVVQEPLLISSFAKILIVLIIPILLAVLFFV